MSRTRREFSITEEAISQVVVEFLPYRQLHRALSHGVISVQALLVIAYCLLQALAICPAILLQTPRWRGLTQASIDFLGIIEHVEVFVAILWLFLWLFLHVGE